MTNLSTHEDRSLHSAMARLLRGLSFVWVVFFAFSIGLVLRPFLTLNGAVEPVPVQHWFYALLAAVGLWLAWRAYTNIWQPFFEIRDRAGQDADWLLSRCLRSAMAPGALIAFAFVPAAFIEVDLLRIAALVCAFGVMNWADNQVPDLVRRLMASPVAA